MSPVVKLTEEQKEEIRNLYKTGEHSQAALAKKYNVHVGTISRLINDPTGERTRKNNNNYRLENKEKIAQTEKENNRFITLRFHKEINKEMIAFLDFQENRRQYILNLIQRDMNTRPDEVALAVKQYEEKENK